MVKNFIENYIKEEKSVVNKSHPKYQEKNRHRRMNVDIRSKDGNRKYTMFVRQLLALPEDFSVGLIIEPPNDHFTTSTVLIRFQGPHGGQSEAKSADSIHNSYHIHRLTEDDVENHRYKPRYREETSSFSSIEEAIIYCLDYCNIKDEHGIFNEERDNINQIHMDFMQTRRV